MELVVMDIMDTRYLHQYCDPGAGGDNYRDTVLLAKVMEQLFVIVQRPAVGPAAQTTVA